MCWQPCALAIVESSQPLLVAQSGQQNWRRQCVAGSPGWLPPGHLVLGQDQEASLGAWSREPCSIPNGDGEGCLLVAHGFKFFKPFIQQVYTKLL